MKKIIAAVSATTLAFGLAACGGSEVDEPTEAVIEDGADSVIPSNTAGTYSRTNDEGSEAVTVLAEDGSYTITVDGEQAETGTWEDNIRGTCLITEGTEEEDCYNVQPGAEEGMVDVTGPDGETTSWSFEA